jgi:hypothetical protein
MEGYYYDPTTKRYQYGNNPQASSTVEGAMAARGETMVPDYTPAPSPKVSKESSGSKALSKGGAAAAKEMSGDSPDAESAIGTGLMASGNPYAMAGGAALLTAKSINDARYQDALARYQGAEKGLTTGLGGQFKI